MKQVINFDKCEFEIRVMPHGQALGLYMIRENQPDNLLTQKWTEQECRSYITSNFIGEKGTKLNLRIQKHKTVRGNDGYLYKIAEELE